MKKLKQCPHCLALFEDTDKCPVDHCALQTPKNIDPLLGTCLAERYKIISLLGSGGMGNVYKAEHVAMDRLVAVKILHPHLAARAHALKRFHEEAKTIAQLKHHNIITLYDFGISPNNQPYLVMDYINGFSLRKLVDESGTIPLEYISPILKQVVDGLSYAHGENVIHRDLKPENIMLTRIDQNQYKVVLVDFGLALFSAEQSAQAAPASKGSALLGSPFYMSPEQCLVNGVVDNRCDIYSLAIVLYEALCGRLPYEKKSGMAMLESHLHKQPLPFNLTQPGLKVCTELTRVFNQALAKEPDNRFQAIDEFGIAMIEAVERDAVKWRAIKHRTVVARQTMNNAGSPVDPGSISQEKFDESLFDLQFQTGSKFLSRQAEIEAGLFPAVQQDGINNASSSSEELEQKQCFYCGAMIPAGVQFCLSCQRKIKARPSKLSETYNCLNAAPYDLNTKENEQLEQARSNIRSLRHSNLSTALAKTQRTLIYAITIILLFTTLMFFHTYLDIAKSAKYLGQFVGYPTKSMPASSVSFKKRH